MKTTKSLFLHYILLIVAATNFSGPGLLRGQTELPEDFVRPSESDQPSLQLIENFLTVTGGAAAYREIENVVATGTLKIHTLERRFHLVENQVGQRRIIYEWVERGRPHSEAFGFDGAQIWTQALLPEETIATETSDAEAKHFAKVLWLLQPVVEPRRGPYVFQYGGTTRVKGRAAHLVKGYGPDNQPAWFYFDQESSLITRWGALGEIAGVTQYIDYQAQRFNWYDGYLFPAELELVAQDAIYGRVVFEQIRVNQPLSDDFFKMPERLTPTLRQRPVPSD